MSRKEGIDFVMDKNKLDALIAPTGGPAWTTDWINGDHFTGGYSTASAVADYRISPCRRAMFVACLWAFLSLAAPGAGRCWLSWSSHLNRGPRPVASRSFC